jgi:hypothetical protein
VLPAFIIGHESLQQHESIFLSADGFGFWAKPTPAIAIISPSRRPGTSLRALVIFISPVRKRLLPDISRQTDAFSETACHSGRPI